MSTIIKNGTIVTADRTWKGDVLMRHGIIVAIGPDLHGDHEFDATGCHVMPGGIDPHTHLEMPFMGTYSSDDFESGTRAALAGGTTMVIDFCLPSPNQSLLDALKMWDNKTSRASCDYSFHMAITWWGEQVWREMADVVDRGITSFKHFMAYKGALMVNDDEMFQSYDPTRIATRADLATLLDHEGVAVRYGHGPAVLSSFLSVAAFDFFFVPPRLSFAVSDTQYLLTFAVLLVVALVISQLTASLRYQAHIATYRERRTSAVRAPGCVKIRRSSSALVRSSGQCCSSSKRNTRMMYRLSCRWRAR